MTEATECACLACRPTATGLPSDLPARAAEIHGDNIHAGWWKTDPETGRTLNRNVGELLALVHSEISEADEGYENHLQDDKLPHRLMAEVELADTAIRVLDILGFYAQPEDWHQSLLNSDSTATFNDRIRYMHRITTRALEGFRKGNPRAGCQALIDLLSLLHFTALRFGFDLEGVIAEKRRFNAVRQDHRLEVRAAAGGKQF